jgi:CreA protein
MRFVRFRLLPALLLPALAAMVLGAVAPASPALAQDVIFKKSTVWKMLTPDDKLVVYGVDDPAIEGVACHYTAPERGGVAGMFGVAEELSDISLACRQIGPIKFKEKMSQGDVVFRESRSLIWKKMQIVRGCDAKRNVLIYMVYSDRLIEGSPKNSTSSVPIMPWGGTGETPKCSEWTKS